MKCCIPFAGTVTAGGELTLCSDLISLPFTLNSVLISFALNTNRTVQIDIFASPDNDTPTTGRPAGSSLCELYGQVNYIVGDDEQKFITHDLVCNERVTYLKVYAKNTDIFDHTVDVICFITTESSP